MIEESTHRQVCDALHRAIVERDRLRAEVERQGMLAIGRLFDINDLVIAARAVIVKASDRERCCAEIDALEEAANRAGRTGEVLDAQHERLTRLKARKAAGDPS